MTVDLDTAKYYVLTVAPGRELDGEMILRNRGWDVTTPSEFRMVRKGIRRVYTEVRRPLTPRYLIIAHTGPLPVYRLREENQGIVSGYLSFADGYPYQIAKGVIDELLAKGAKSVAMNLGKSFRVGDDVTIDRDAWAGHTGPLKSLDGDQATVLLTMFGGMREVPISVHNLKAA